jgi:hypothetical protein
VSFVSLDTDVSFKGSSFAWWQRYTTDQLLEGIATGKADAGLGLALRWLKPLEQGFDVRITAGVHGGCIRLLGAPTRKPFGLSDRCSNRNYGKQLAR